MWQWLKQFYIDARQPLMKRIADALEKMAVVGLALAAFQGNTANAKFAVLFFVVSCILSVWEKKL